jgi:hypothetical protein
MSSAGWAAADFEELTIVTELKQITALLHATGRLQLWGFLVIAVLVTFLACGDLMSSKNLPRKMIGIGLFVSVVLIAILAGFLSVVNLP